MATIDPNSPLTTAYVGTPYTGAVPAAGQQPTGAAGGLPPAALATVQGLQDRHYAYTGIAGNAGGSSSASCSAASCSAASCGAAGQGSLKQLEQEYPDLKSIMSSHPDLDVGTLEQLNQQGSLGTFVQEMQQHPDWGTNDLITTGANGKMELNPVFKNQDAVSLLNNRGDIKPQDLEQMFSTIQSDLGNNVDPTAMEGQACQLLKNRSDLQPQDVGQMVDSLANAATGGNGKVDPSSMEDMFSHATQLLDTRSDVSCQSIGQLAMTCKTCFCDPNSSNGAQDTAQGFDQCCDIMSKDKGMTADGMEGILGSLQNHIQDPSQRLQAMSSIDQMAQTGTTEGLNAKNIDQTFSNLEAQGKHGQQLTNAFSQQCGAVASGKQTMGQMVANTAPQQQPQQGKHNPNDPNNPQNNQGPNGQGNNGQNAGNPFTGGGTGNTDAGTGGGWNQGGGAWGGGPAGGGGGPVGGRGFVN